MKKIFLATSICFISSFLAGQSRQQRTDSVCLLVKQYFNAKDADKLYALGGEVFQKAMTADRFREVVETNLFPLGAMQTQFDKDSGRISKYKADFTTVSLALYVSLDDKDKLTLFLFRPYSSEAVKKSQVATNNPLSTPLDQLVDSAVRRYMSMEATCGLSIGILQNDKVYFYGYGETVRGNKQVPDKNTIFEIGSISKTFTATLLADAINAGKMKQKDPISKYLPDSIPPLQSEGVPVVLDMLSNHSSGMPRMPAGFDAIAADALNPYKNYSAQNLFSALKVMKFDQKPGTKLAYSNFAAALLGLILERLENKTYEQLVVEKICSPLGMNDTRQHIRKNDSARVAAGYAENGTYNGPWDFSGFAAAGALRSTASDMLLYAKANLGNAPSALSKDVQLSHVPTFTDGSMKIGLGWFILKPGKDEILFHNGGTGGYRSYLGINPGKRFAVIILSNTSIGVDGIGNGMMTRLEKN